MVRNSQNDPQMQKRILVATVVSFIFFITYDYLFLPKSNNQIQNNQTEVSIEHSKKGENDAPQASAKVSQKPQSVENKSNNTIEIFEDQKVISTVKTKTTTYEIDSLGRISQVYLNGDKFKDETGKSLELFNKDYVKPLETRFSNKEINELAFKTAYIPSTKNLVVNGANNKLTLTQSFKDVKIVKVITFLPNGDYSVKVDINKPTPIFITPGFRPDVATDMYTFHGTLLSEVDDTLTMIEAGDTIQNPRFNNSLIAAAVDRYYCTLFYDFNKGLDGVIDKYKEEDSLIFLEIESGKTLNGYIGAKDYNLLANIDKNLTDVIDYGFMTFFAKPLFLLLMAINDYVGNWGWSIVVLTLLIRLVLYPLTYKGMMSMQKLKDLAPRIKELQEKYKGNPQKASAAMMDLYKKNDANPMGGCLPLLLQMPVFFAIYRVLLNSIELKHSEWILWIDDLSVMDPYFILPILLGVSMYVQQKITPTTITDPMQQKIFQWLPVIFVFFFLTFPAGLTLYWFVNNLFSLAQQYYINNLFEKRKAQAKEQKLHEKEIKKAGKK
jgi:YidC/Oxa1 family membrane protein insertase